MSFTADKQTLEDLNLLGKFRQHSIYSLFNKVKTAGGERLLDEMFHQPMTDPEAINKRSSLFRYFQGKQLQFPLRHESFRLVEQYLGAGGAGNVLTAAAGMLRKKVMSSLLRDEEYSTIQSGLIATIEALNVVKELLSKLDIEQVKPAQAILASSQLAWLGAERGVKELPVLKMAKYDRLLRHTLRDEMETVLNSIYELDICIAVSDEYDPGHGDPSPGP
jgi:DNA mismatch repair protein MutS